MELAEYDAQGKEAPAKLAEDEELNAEKLNGLKTALDDLLIIDVERKPKGLSQDLRATEEFSKDNEATSSLVTRGFYPVPLKDHVEIFSSEGEATCTTKDGVRYVLRFGRLAGGNEEKDDQPDAEGKPKSDPALNRYLFVMAQFDENQIPKPQLEPVPGAEPADEAKPAEEPKSEEPKAGETPPAAEKPAEEKVPEKKTAQVDGKAADVPAEPAQEAAPAAAEKAPAEPEAAKPTEKPAPRLRKRRRRWRSSARTSAARKSMTTRSRRARTRSRS